MVPPEMELPSVTVQRTDNEMGCVWRDLLGL